MTHSSESVCALAKCKAELAVAKTPATPNLNHTSKQQECRSNNVVKKTVSVCNIVIQIQETDAHSVEYD